MCSISVDCSVKMCSISVAFSVKMCSISVDVEPRDITPRRIIVVDYCIQILWTNKMVYLLYYRIFPLLSTLGGELR